MLIVGMMEVINLAHGSLFALGAYVALYFIGASATPASYALALFAAPIAVGAFGMLLELCMRRTYGRDPLYGLLLTFGAALVIEELIRMVWGSRERTLPVPDAISGAVLIGELVYAKYRFFACAFAAVLAGILVGLVVGLTGAYASEWSLLSMYLLFIAVVTVRARGLFGKKSALDA